MKKGPGPFFLTPNYRKKDPVHFSSATPTFLMCRPTYYRIAYEINPWMSLTHPASHARAQRQWQQLYDTLTQRLHARVRLLRPAAAVPDLVFTANAGLVAGRTFIRSNFRYPQRQGEEPLIERWARAQGYRVVTLPRGLHFEGEGDALFAGETLFFGYRFRSDLPAHREISERLGCRVLSLELTHRRFYHLDTCFCPLGAQTALYYPAALDAYGRKVIRHFLADAIPVGAADARRFVCNAIVVGRWVVVQAGVSRTLARALASRGFSLLEIDLREFHKAGGSAKCLVLRLA